VVASSITPETPITAPSDARRGWQVRSIAVPVRAQPFDDLRRLLEALVDRLADRDERVDSEHRLASLEEGHDAPQVDDKEEHRSGLQDLVHLPPAAGAHRATIGPVFI
jgi:hypothetical protein